MRAQMALADWVPLRGQGWSLYVVPLHGQGWSLYMVNLCPLCVVPFCDWVPLPGPKRLGSKALGCRLPGIVTRSCHFGKPVQYPFFRAARRGTESTKAQVALVDWVPLRGPFTW